MNNNAEIVNIKELAKDYIDDKVEDHYFIYDIGEGCTVHLDELTTDVFKDNADNYIAVKFRTN